MTNHAPNAFLLALFAVNVGAAPPPPAATYRVIVYLTSQNQGPIGIVQGSPGLFYSQNGNIISVTTQGTVNTLATFPDPPYTVESYPVAAANGLAYSSIDQIGSGGGSANVFSVNSTPGSELTYPVQSLAPVIAGNLPNGILFGVAYGFTGGPPDFATVDLAGNVAPLYQFPSGDRPGAPIYGADGDYYGTSQPAAGGGNAYFYRLTPSEAFTKLVTLPFVTTDFLGGGLVLQGTDGNFYGIQSTGLGCSSDNPHGGVYKLTLSGQYTLLHDFGVCGKAVVNSLIEASDGKLYGTIQGTSVLFSLTKSGDYRVVFNTTNGLTQGVCQCTLVQGSDGIIYGTAVGGGPSNFGVIFALDAGLPAPKPRAQEFTPKAGAVGGQVQIWGQNLLAASVQFDGVAATQVSNSGPNYVLATVPVGATTGPITVTTPGGTVTTKAKFTVK
jgi:uncharacterized repeat protein (TIGR03803 family)